MAHDIAVEDNGDDKASEEDIGWSLRNASSSGYDNRKDDLE